MSSASGLLSVQEGVESEGAAPRISRNDRDPHPVRVRPWRSAILLVAGDKAGRWDRWYDEAIPRAEHLYEIYLKERAEGESGR